MTRPARNIVRTCDHCHGEGEVDVFCDDCGDELTTENVAEHNTGRVGDDDICKTCATNRLEDDEPTAVQVSADGSGK